MFIDNKWTYLIIFNNKLLIQSMYDTSTAIVPHFNTRDID